jgi:hypothetical protein
VRLLQEPASQVLSRLSSPMGFSEPQTPSLYLSLGSFLAWCVCFDANPRIAKPEPAAPMAVPTSTWW